MEYPLIVSALLLGLATGLHCVGMCGPIAISLGLNPKNKFSFTSKNLTYQMGRVTTYSLMGLVIGFFGEGLNMVGVQQYVSILAGVAMILMVILPKNLTGQAIATAWAGKQLVKLKSSLAHFIQKKNYTSLYITGLLNGLLPCGPVYVALTGALAVGSLVGSVLFMFFFGLGTIPMMFLTVLAGNFISTKVRSQILKYYPIIMIIIGVLFILRGLQLGIPLLSPPPEVLELNAKGSCH